jgi:hypothetical protein
LPDARRNELDPTGRWRLLDPRQVERWLRDGLFDQLLGTLVPDIVIHASGNPLQGQRVYDFKFPCRSTGEPSWRVYAEGHPHHPKDQGQMYKDALGAEKASLVTPQFGITP